jgi:hypothetical protein
MQYVSRNGCTFPNAKYLQLYAVYMQKGKIFFASQPRPDSFTGHLGHTASDSSHVPGTALMAKSLLSPA